MECVAASEAGKMYLYACSILDSLQLPQNCATPLYEDNAAVTIVVNSSKSTNQAQHFALLDWRETNQIILTTFITADKPAVGLISALGPQNFARYSCMLLCKRQPGYCQF